MAADNFAVFEKQNWTKLWETKPWEKKKKTERIKHEKTTARSENRRKWEKTKTGKRAAASAGNLPEKASADDPTKGGNPIKEQK